MVSKYSKFALCMFPAIFGLAAACERPFIAQDGAEAALRAEHGSLAVASFLDAAFGRDLGQTREASRLTRWCGPVVFEFAGEPGAVHRSVILHQLADLGATTGQSFVAAGSEDGADDALLEVILPADRDAYLDEVRRHFSHDWRMRRLVARANCFFRYLPDDQGCIAEAVTVIPLDLDEERFRHCVAEELTQVMGLPADLDMQGQSVLASSGRVPGITDLDRTLLKLLYHPALRPGMSRHEAASAARRALMEIEAEEGGASASPPPG